MSGEIYSIQRYSRSPQEAFLCGKEIHVPIRGDSRAVCQVSLSCVIRRESRFLAPGELITDEIIEYILYAKEKGCSMQGTEDPAVEYLNVL